jgi:hypothetical protein
LQAITAYGSLTLFRNIFRNFAPRFPEKKDESKRREVCSSVSGRFLCVLIAHIRGFTPAVSDQARATIGKSRRYAMNRPACKTDIWILPQGTLTLVRPLTQRASQWISQHVQDDFQWFGPALLIEHHYLGELLNGMIEEGLHVTQ